MKEHLVKDLETDAAYLTRYANGFGGKDPQRIVECTTTMLRAAFALKKSVWTSVNDRLPDLHEDFFEDGDERVYFEISDPVLCVYNGDEQIVAVYEEDDHCKGWVSPFDGASLHSVTHWRPLPELP